MAGPLGGNLNPSLPQERVCSGWRWKGEDVCGSLWQRPCLPCSGYLMLSGASHPRGLMLNSSLFQRGRHLVVTWTRSHQLRRGGPSPAFPASPVPPHPTPAPCQTSVFTRFHGLHHQPPLHSTLQSACLLAFAPAIAPAGSPLPPSSPSLLLLIIYYFLLPSP